MKRDNTFSNTQHVYMAFVIREYMLALNLTEEMRNVIISKKSIDIASTDTTQTRAKQATHMAFFNVLIKTHSKHMRKH